MKLPTHISYNLKKSFYLLSWKSLSRIKFQNWNISKWNSNILNTPCHLNKWKKSCHLLSRVLYLKRLWIHGDQNAKCESLGKPFYSLSFNFPKSFEFHSINHTTIKQSIYLSIYYNIPKFRILGCYKPTTLKMNLVLEIWRG